MATVNLHLKTLRTVQREAITAPINFPLGSVTTIYQLVSEKTTFKVLKVGSWTEQQAEIEKFRGKERNQYFPAAPLFQ